MISFIHVPLLKYGTLMGHFKPTYDNKKQLNESDCGTIVVQNTYIT